MKRHLLSLFLVVVTSFVQAQNSNAKIQWVRKQYGIASDNERARKSYRDPSTGNVYVLYQGSINFGVARFDNSGANTASYKHIAPYNGFSFGADLKYTGNNSFVACGGQAGVYPLVVKGDMNGNTIWKYVDTVSTFIAYDFLYDLTKSITVSANNNVVAGGVSADTATLYSLTQNGALNWKKHYTPAGYSEGTVLGVQTDAFNNIYACGTVRKASSGDYDAFVVSYDMNGNILWEHLINGAVSGGCDSAITIRIDNSGNTYVGGIIKDTSANNSSLFAVKYNASGGIQYMKKYHAPGQLNAVFGDVYTDLPGNLYITGYSYFSASNATSILLKYSSSGSQQWYYNYDDPNFQFDRAQSLKIDAQGAVHLAGTSDSGPFAGPSDEFIVKISAAGVPLWNQVYNNSNNFQDKLAEVLVDNSGNSFLVGTNDFYYVFDCDVTLVKYSTGGLMQWEGLFDSPGNLSDEATELIKDGSYAVYTLSTISNNISNMDAVITKYNSQGVLLWQASYDYATADNYAKSMVMDSQKNLYVLCNANGGYNSSVLKYDSLGTQIFEKILPDGYTEMVIDTNDDLYLGGGLGSNSADFNALKLDKNGNVVWTYTPAAGTYSHRADKVAVSNTGELYIFGSRSPNSGTYIMRVAKFNAGGTLAWSYDLPNTDTTTYRLPVGLKLDASGNMYITCQDKDVNLTNPLMLLMKINSAGAQVWRTGYNANDTRWVVPNDLQLDSFGDLWTIDGAAWVQKWDVNTGANLKDVNLASTYNGPGIVLGGNNLVRRYDATHLLITHFIGMGNSNSMGLTKTDTSVVAMWTQTYDGAADGSEWAADIEFDQQGRIIIQANSNETEGSYNDVAVIKFCDMPVPSISSSGVYTNICPGNPVTITAGAGTGYLWAPGGSTQQSVTTDTTGNYYCFVYASDGCYQSTDTLHVTRTTPPAVQNICLVTVDSMSTHNVVIWDKTGLNLVSHFNIYREDITNSYNLIAQVSYDSLSEYHDHAADPNVTTKRYKVTAVDSCGTESAFSPYHNTIYIADNGSGQFTWNLYSIENSPNPVTKYLLMRDDNGTGAWHQIDSTAGTQQTLNDPNYPGYLNGLWRVETVWGISCTSTMRSGNNNTQATIVKSKSNISNNRQIGVKSNAEKLLKVYPNPTNGNVTITFAPAEGTIVKVMSLLGEEVFSETFAAGSAKCEVDLSKYQSGIYLVQVTTNEQTFQKRVVKH